MVFLSTEGISSSCHALHILWMALSWVSCHIAFSAADTLPCPFVEEDARERYEITRQQFYPYRPQTYGIEALEDTENVLGWGTVQATGSARIVCPSSPPNPRRGVSPDSDSMCPWEFVDEYEAGRFPAVIARARCLCTPCLDPVTSEVAPDLLCQEITYRMQIFRRVGCLMGLYQYNVTVEDVPVACACMRNPRTSQQPVCEPMR